MRWTLRRNPERAPVAGRPRARWVGRHDPDAARIISVVAAHRRIAAGSILRKHRNLVVVRARQVAMYLIHVGLGRRYADIAAIFRCDRTTAAYACARIEEERDDPRFDADIARLEAFLLADGDDDGVR